MKGEIQALRVCTHTLAAGPPYGEAESRDQDDASTVQGSAKDCQQTTKGERPRKDLSLQPSGRISPANI